MTSPNPAPGPSGSSAPARSDGAPTTSQTPGAQPGELGEQALAALQSAMAAEHAALWAYGLVAAYDPTAADTVSTMVANHQDLRDLAANLLVQGGATPVGPAPAYETPGNVTDEASALALALTIEQDCASAWHWVIGNTEDSTLRGTALSALTDCAMRMVTWRQAAKDAVVTVPFPGAPDMNQA